MDSRRFRFGLFAFDASNGELRREERWFTCKRNRRGPFAADLACGRSSFTRRTAPGNLGDETFVNFERGLNVCIAQIRTALGDDSVSPRFVRTVPRLGYQFIAPSNFSPAQFKSQLRSPLPAQSSVARRCPFVRCFAAGRSRNRRLLASGCSLTANAGDGSCRAIRQRNRRRRSRSNQRWLTDT